MKPYEKLKSIRIKKGITTYELSELTGIPQSTISKMENGKRKIEVEELEILAKYLNVQISVFFNDNNTVESSNKVNENTTNPRFKPIIDSLDRAGDLKDEDINEISAQLEFLINLKKKKKNNK